MTTDTFEIDAVYENGILRPVLPLKLSEQQRVRVKILRSQATVEEKLAALAVTTEHRKRMEVEFGVFPDSTPLIAEDRLRDV